MILSCKFFSGLSQPIERACSRGTQCGTSSVRNNNYPVRHHLVQQMVNSIQRLGFSPTTTIDHRRLAVELAEVIIKWELHRIKDEAENTETGGTGVMTGSLKRSRLDKSNAKRMATQAGINQGAVAAALASPGLLVTPKMETDATKPIERAHADAILNF